MRPKFGKAVYHELAGMSSFPVLNYRERGTRYPVVLMGAFLLGWRVIVTFENGGTETREGFKTRAEAVAHIENSGDFEEVAA